MEQPDLLQGDDPGREAVLHAGEAEYAVQQVEVLCAVGFAVVLEVVVVVGSEAALNEAAPTAMAMSLEREPYATALGGEVPWMVQFWARRAASHFSRSRCCVCSRPRALLSKKTASSPHRWRDSGMAGPRLGMRSTRKPTIPAMEYDPPTVGKRRLAAEWLGVEETPASPKRSSFSSFVCFLLH